MVTFSMGMVACYFGIRYQSLWVCFGIHAVWNLATLLMLVPIVSILLGLIVYERMMSWRSKRGKR